jgi:hypothetical protein
MSRSLSAIIGALFLTGCASTGPTATTVSDPIGPRPLGLARDYVGFLEVCSATEEHADGDNTYRYPHTDYQIFTSDGQLFKQVRNAITLSDESPERVTLPKGRYVVAAQSETSGLVNVPVVIETGKTTVLHLERQKDWKPELASRESDLVRLPNGQVIGYRGR